MSLWRYTALAPGTGDAAIVNTRTGEISADSAAAVRASLRRIGLQVIDVKPVHRRNLFGAKAPAVFKIFLEVFQRHLRGRRRLESAEVFDSLSTMLSSGLPLLEAFDALIHARQRGRRSCRSMLMSIKERLRSGGSLGQAMREHPGWFDAAEVAIVDAGQHSGNLHQVLASLAERHQQAGDLGQKLIAALAYPFFVLLVGIGVAIFLSLKTLPELTKILSDAKVPIPALTARVMGVGQLLTHHWFIFAFTLLIILAAIPLLPGAIRRMPWEMPESVRRMRWLRPRVVRTIAVGGMALRLAQLVRSGVPMVDSLRVIAPTTRHYTLRQELLMAADSVERGDELSEALDDEHWFDSEFQRLLEIGQTTGELDQMLQRIGDRYQRQAKRLIDRLAAMLEPIVILCLAVFVGTVVMA